MSKVSFYVTVAAVLAAVPTVAQAQQVRRPDVRTMSCDDAKRLVNEEGGIVLTTGQHTYDRYVSDRMYCPTGLDIKDAWVDTGDGQSCRIGYTCVIEPRFPLFRAQD
jgi:hypothetical protein